MMNLSTEAWGIIQSGPRDANTRPPRHPQQQPWLTTVSRHTRPDPCRCAEAGWSVPHLLDRYTCNQDWLIPQVAVPHTLTLLGGARFIDWHLGRSFFKECRRGPRNFWECLACLGYVPVPRPNLNRPCATLTRLVGRVTNTVCVIALGIYLCGYLWMLNGFTHTHTHTHTQIYTSFYIYI